MCLTIDNPKPILAHFARTGLVDDVETLENAAKLLFGYANSTVDDVNLHAIYLIVQILSEKLSDRPYPYI